MFVGAFISFNDTCYNQETRTLDYIFMKRNKWSYYEDPPLTVLSNFAPANLDMIPHMIGKGRTVVGTTKVFGGRHRSRCDQYTGWFHGGLEYLCLRSNNRCHPGGTRRRHGHI